MLDLALNYQEKLTKKLRETWMDDRYKRMLISSMIHGIAISMFRLRTEKS